MPETSPSDLKRFLLAQHPWYQRMATRENWPKIRAVMGELNEEPAKREYLVKGNFEKKKHFDVRLQLTEFAGVFGGILERYIGAVFGQEAEVSYEAPKKASQGAGGTEPSKPADGGAITRDLEAWASNVDGAGTTLREVLEDQAPEALGPGVVGFFVDRPPLPEGVTPDRLKNVADQKSAGVYMPRLVPYTAEEITDWGEDTAGRLTWVKLTRIVSVQDTPLSDRHAEIEFIVLDQTSFVVYRAKFKDGVQSGSGEVSRKDWYGFPIPELPKKVEGIEDPKPIRNGTHGCNCVPFVVLPGGMLKGALMASPPLMAVGRTDIALLNEDSQSCYARYLHNVPFLKLKLADSKRLEEIERSEGSAILLNAGDGEDAEYASTPSEGFEVAMKAVEGHRLEGYRQAGADPTGLFEATSTAESGRAKETRFSNTEARFLAKFAKRVAAAHWGILEIVSRRLSSSPPPIDQAAFEGTVRYPARFDTEDADALIDRFGATRSWLSKSPTYLRGCLKAVARAVRGDISEQERQKIDKEIDGISDEQLTEDLVVASDADSGDEDDADGAVK